MSRDTDHPSYWIESTAARPRGPLQGDEEADVVVVGAGIVGLTAAHLLAKAGKEVVVLDRMDQIVRGDTGHTTAHLAYVVDTPLPKLVEVHGEAKAKLAWDGSRFAIELIERVAREEAIDCDFARVDGFLYGPRDEDPQHLDRYAELARRIGYEAQRVDPGDVPFRGAKAALRFPGQARFHPRKYLLQLADRLEARGVRIYERTEAREVETDEGEGRRAAVVRTREGPVVRAEHVVLATHVPFTDRLRLWTRLYPYRSYVVAARLPRGAVRDALYWDTLEPFHYTRLQPEDGHDVLIFGGEDHKVGHVEETGKRWDSLERTLRESLRVDADWQVEWRWSAQDPSTHDHLPYIGTNPGGGENELVATGFGGSGMTYGTLAGWMLAERIRGGSTPYDDLYDPERITLKELRRYVRENKDYPQHLVKDYAKERRGPPVEELRPGQGTVITSGVKKIAVAMDDAGRLHAVSATCTHMGCVIHWNDGERSWDCPCHGSRYNLRGEILEGPAPEPLAPVGLDELPRRPARERPAGG